MILVPAGVDRGVKVRFDVKVYCIVYTVIVGHCCPCHDPISRWIRWGCEGKVKFKGIE